MMQLKAVLWTCCVVAAAYLGFLVCRLMVPGADVRGGFLLLSPLIALSLTAVFGPWAKCFRAPANTAPADLEMSIRVRALADKLGVPAPEVAVITTERFGFSEGLGFLDDKLHFYLANWNQLSSSDQDFILATRLAGHFNDRQRRNRPLEFLIYIAASVVACVNLWWILVLHSGGAISLAWITHQLHIRRTLDLDVRAARATGDLEGAKAYIRRTCKHHLEPTADRRIANLEAAFAG